MKCQCKTNISGQVMVEYLLLVSMLILGLAATFAGLKAGVFEYYRFLTTLICLPFP